MASIPKRAEAPLLITVVGPTAIGKTSLAIRIAQAIGAEILSSDSRQFYREIPIGTAQPTIHERASAPHHFIDFLSVTDDYSSGRFETDAVAWLSDHFAARRQSGLPQVAVMAGGSGLYVQAVQSGLDAMPSDDMVRNELNAIYASDGLAPLLAELKRLDPVHHEQVDLANPRRVIRALEVCRCSGQPYTQFRRSQADRKTIHPGGWGRHIHRPWDTLTLGIGSPRDYLHDRINRRTHLMLEQGWLREAETVMAHRNCNALKTVGYPQLFDVLEGRTNMDTAIRKIQEATRQFARRQLTWFHRQQDVHWIDARRLDDGLSLAQQFIQHGHV